MRPAGGENAIGHFVNVLPVILEKGRGDAPFSALLHEAQAAEENNAASDETASSANELGTLAVDMRVTTDRFRI